MNLKLLTLSTVLVLSSTCSQAAALEQESMGSADGGAGNMEKLTKYLKNFGAYMGYNLEQKPNIDPKAALLRNGFVGPIANTLYNTYLGALLGLKNSQALGADKGEVHIPDGILSQTFKDFQASQSSTSGKIGFSDLFNQPPPQTDPVGQAVLDILSTPSFLGCYSSDTAKPTIQECANSLFREKLMGNVIGTIPKANDLYKADKNAKWVSELNSNSLLSPLMYKDSEENQQGGGQESEGGLISKSPTQAAGNFVNFVSGLVLPLNLPTKKNYDYVLSIAGDPAPPGVSLEDNLRARGNLLEYLNKLKVYSAQLSVGLGNLYYIISKRLPQTMSDGSGSSKQTSQALNEFNMATWRLKIPASTGGGPADESWIQQINKASPATVQKEIAILLAEMNYQLYLNRQQQERILLTESILLFQGSKNMQPMPVIEPLPPQEAPPTTQAQPVPQGPGR